MNFEMKCGKETMAFDYPDENVLAVLKTNPVQKLDCSQNEIIKQAIEHPIGCPSLKKMMKPGDTVAVVIPDITRNWQSSDVYMPVLIDALNAAGINDEDILIISATGTHREQTREEHIACIGEDLYKRIKIVDHVCTDTEHLTSMGTTSHGTPVELDSRAIERDHIILTGGVVYHFLAGFGGGRKCIVPGIASRETIMKHHSLALNKGMGSGSNPNVCSGNISASNPFHMDMMEAAAMAQPCFILNVVVDTDFGILRCYAGDYIKAHQEACKLVDQLYGIELPCEADLSIATAGGFPKDINFYQTSKTFFNAIAATKKGGTMIVASACSEGLGDPDLAHIFCDFKTMGDREKAVREHFSIGGFIGFKAAEAAEHYHFILVTTMDEKYFANSHVHVTRSIKEAIALAYQLEGRTDLKAYIMPHGANTLPKIKR